MKKSRSLFLSATGFYSLCYRERDLPVALYRTVVTSPEFSPYFIISKFVGRNRKNILFITVNMIIIPERKIGFTIKCFTVLGFQINLTMIICIKNIIKSKLNVKFTIYDSISSQSHSVFQTNSIYFIRFHQ